MIKKIGKIKNIGSFQYFEWEKANPPYRIDPQGNVELRNEERQRIGSDFKKYNLVYGENGTGKTNFVRIFKSLNENSRNLLPKHWDRKNENRDVSVILENDTNLVFDEVQGWNDNCLQSKFVFFDKPFINDYVHTLGHRAVEHDKKTGDLILVIGNFYAYQNNLDNLDTLKQKLKEKNVRYQNEYQRSFRLLPNNNFDEDSIEVHFNSLKALSDAKRKTNLKVINSQIESRESEIKRNNTILRREENIVNLSELETVEQVPTLSEKLIDEIFKFTVSRGTLAVLNKIENKVDFISFGWEQIKDQNLDVCPFCEQKIKKKDKYIHVIQEYERIFDEEFERQKNKIESELNSYHDAINKLFRIRRTKNEKLIKDVNKYCSLDEELPNLNLLLDEEKILDAEISQIEQKKDNLLSIVTTEYPDKIKLIFEKMKRTILDYNSNVLRINESVNDIKEGIKTGKFERKKADLERELNTLKEKKFCHDNFNNLKSIFLQKKTYLNNERVIACLDTLLRKYGHKVEIRFENFVKEYLADFKKHLREFCPPLKIVNIKKTRGKYDGRARKILCGFELQYKNKDRLSELSEGEKQAIALAYFFSYLDKVQNLTETIVVFDDPITSFDAGRRKTLSAKIFNITQDFQQVFVLTCDPLFRYYCFKHDPNRFGEHRNVYQIFKSASSSIHYREKRKISIYNAFRAKFRDIESENGTDENIVIYGQMLRFCLEEVKDTHLGYCEENFFNILNKIKKTDFDKLKDSIDEILEIYTYCNTGGLAHYPRDGQTSWDELKTYINKYLALDLN